LYAMRTARTGIVQSQLFGSRGTVERFRFDASSRIISRVVSRRGSDDVVVSEIGAWNSPGSVDDLRSAADMAYLQRTTTPPSAITTRQIRLADLFSGCGAMSLGISEACRALDLRFAPVGVFDTNPRVLEVYAANFGIPVPEAVNLAEVLEADIEAVPTPREQELVASLGEVDFVIAGPPCQGHSNLNNRTRRKDPKNALYFLVARFAILFRPKWIIIENVTAVRHDQGDVVNRTQVALEQMGFETADGIVDLRSLGIPQTRRRHVMVAQRRDGELSSPRELPFLDDLLTPYLTRERNLRWAIEDLLNVSENDFLNHPKRPDPITQARIDYLFDNGIFDLPNSQRPDCHKPGNHTYSSVYGRMKWEDPAPTLTGGFDTMGRGRFVHPKRRRTITPHEAARIQGIPDFFDFSALKGLRTALVETIGNAVPPKLSYVLALELMR
jgi:DNA (cytosine-5)-methyltransferase 1